MQKTILLGLLMASGLGFGQQKNKIKKQKTQKNKQVVEVKPVVKRVKSSQNSSVYDVVDQEAQFVGGISRFRQLIRVC